MKLITIIIIFILSLPLAYSLYGGEVWKYHFDKCEHLEVNITATDIIIDGEYVILNNCVKNNINHYICNCSDDYYFNVSFDLNTVNNYTFAFNYMYDSFVEESQSGGSSGGYGRRRVINDNCVWNCTEWSNCQPNGRATRECKDLNNCTGTRLSEKRICYYPKSTIKPSQNLTITQGGGSSTPFPEEEPPEITPIDIKWIYGWVLIILIMLLIIYYYIKKKRKKLK